MRYYLRCLLLLLLGVLASNAKTHSKPASSLTNSLRLLQEAPPQCKEHIQQLLRWYSSLSNGEDVSRIVHLNDTTACQQCFSGKQSNPISNQNACMECHRPYAGKLKQSSNCRKCFNVLKPNHDACRLCFLDVKHKVKTSTSGTKNKIKTAMDKMRLKFRKWF
ncbi:unnamed protein product [Dibothriocephalus latus]|uniref:Uncharacterized protein n=1 Tax=Dibothriocephalus latus TaxID=60516 RepID=A0A3P7MT33_DIBLA|nr:unnamed protein product [Dibothriocephalus latus]